PNCLQLTPNALLYLLSPASTEVDLGLQTNLAVHLVNACTTQIPNLGFEELQIYRGLRSFTYSRNLAF
ncbi:MAG: hypothetical protein AAB414_05255, partial [Patescibacteria group bacterium]